MSTIIKCPNCANEFPLEEVISEEYKKDLHEQMLAYKKEKETEMERKEQEWQRQIQQREGEHYKQLQIEKTKIQQQLEETIRKTVSADFENKFRSLELNNKSNEEKLKQARQIEMEFLKKERDFKNKEAEMELYLQKRLGEERDKIAGEIRRIEVEKNQIKETEYRLELRELKKQLEDTKRIADDLKRKAQQTSSQLHGEVQELLLEELLCGCFPYDSILEVPKGKKGADCILIVRNRTGDECGKILFESKRTTTWGKEWIEKVKHDALNSKADIAVLVSQTLPDKMLDKFEFRDGVWICSFENVKLLTASVREGMLNIYNLNRSQEGRGDKMQMLYDFMTSQEFASKWKNIRDVFSNMHLSIFKEREVMEKLWRNREKQLERALLNSDHIIGSIEGIAGKNTIDLGLLASAGDDEDDMAH